MGSDDTFSRKLKAFLHDPVDKPFILMQAGESHERRAQELAGKLGITLEKEGASDHIASAMERVFLPRGASKNKRLQIKFLERPCVKHPLSGKEFEKIEELENYDIEAFKNVVDNTFLEIASKNFNSDKERFIYLWRNLIPLLVKHSPDCIKKFWSFAPADTRIPDHSIFEHLKISSACYNSTYTDTRLLLNNCSLFLFTIGPVQSFIAQARKTEDLYWGSFILSYLSWKAIEQIVDRYGPDSIIFPDIDSQPLVDCWLEENGINVEKSSAKDIRFPTIPNRFLAIVPESEEEKLSSLGNEIREKINRTFQNIAETILDKLNLSKPDGLDEQIAKFFQMYWVAVPWFRDDNGKQDWENTIKKLKPYFSQNIWNEQKEILEFVKNNGEYRPNIGNVYSVLSSFTEQSLGARKNVRNFEQLEEIGRKCSLCGERNVLFYRCIKDEKEEKRNKKIELLKEQGAFLDNYKDGIIPKYLDTGKGLCGVCFVKRSAREFFKEKYGMDAGFPSTAGIALSEFLNKIDKNKYKAYCNLFGEERFDPQLLYEENLTEHYLERYGFDISQLELDNAKRLRKELINDYNLPKYYAVIMLDGDNMGKWLSGEMAPKFEEIYHPKVWENLPDSFKTKLQGKKRPMTPALHSAISRALRDYSLKFARMIVEETGSGKIVYSGGDDLLAFVNLATLPDVMVRLRAAFSGHLNKELKVDFTNKTAGFTELDDEIILTLGNEATASMGVCIAHYKTPLGVVLNTARKMEQQAKEVSGKNAFAISLLKHSGEITETRFKWWYPEGDNAEEGTISVMKRLVNEFKKGKKEQNKGFSDKFVCNLREEFRQRFVDKEDKITVRDGIIKTEIKRFLSKSYQGPKEEKQVIDELAKSLFGIYCDAGSFRNFISFLETALFLGRKSSL